MVDIVETRRARLKQLVAEHESINALGRALGLKRGAYISSLLNTDRPITEKTARGWEVKLRKPPGWLDASEQPAATVNMDVLTRVLAYTGEELAKAKVQLTPAKSAEVIANQYAAALAAGGVERARIKAFVAMLKP